MPGTFRGIPDLDGGSNYLWSGNVPAGPPGVHAELRKVVGGRVSEDLVAASEVVLAFGRIADG